MQLTAKARNNEENTNTTYLSLETYSKMFNPDKVKEEQLKNKLNKSKQKKEEAEKKKEEESEGVLSKIAPLAIFVGIAGLILYKALKK